MSLLIREETENDYPETETMTRRAFWNKYKPGCDEHLLVYTLHRHPAYLPEFSRVAEVDGHIAGVILYFKAILHTADGDLTVPSFGPLCSDHRYKNCGIGAALLQETLPLVRKAGYPGVIIFGEPEYYPKHGFVRAGSLGLTDMQGNTSDPFMAYECYPRSLHFPGARFDVNAFGIEDGLTEETLTKLEADRNYEYLAPSVRPCQFGYDHASEDGEGYHLRYAVEDPSSFEAMFPEYIAELATYRDSLKKMDIGEILRELRESVSKARYLIMVEKETAGLLVTSVPETADEAENDGCGNWLEEIWVRPKFRHRGIASDIFCRYLRQQRTDTGFCVIPGNPAAGLWFRLLESEGYEFAAGPGEHGLTFCHVRNGSAENMATEKNTEL